MSPAFAGVALLGFMILHLYQFRWQRGALPPAPAALLISFEGILAISSLWTQLTFGQLASVAPEADLGFAPRCPRLIQD